MRINIKATNVELAPAIREYIEKKLIKIEKKLIDPSDTSAMCDVEVGKISKHHKTGDIYKAEFNLHVAGEYVRVEAEESNLYAAIDEARDELFRTLRSHRNKKRAMTKRGRIKFKELLHRLKW